MARISIAVAALLLAGLFHAIIYSPISPQPLILPSSQLTSNDLLKRVERLGEGRLPRPEDVCVDKDGRVYTATEDGWIKRMHPNGTWEEWVMIGGDGLLGITTSRDGDILVCDANKGLLKVGPKGVTVLASQVEDSKIRFADDLIEASDGSVYFSDASTKFGLADWFLDVLEAKPHGRLLKYDSLSNKTWVLLSDLAFANGVALSSDEDFLIVCETWKLSRSFIERMLNLKKFRCLKYWLKGELRGKVEIFIENLPGGPDNVKLAPDGSFWIALLQLYSRGMMGSIHRWSPAKMILASFPKAVETIKSSLKTRAMVINVAADGKRIIRTMDDSDGRVMPLVTSALELDGYLYLGNLGTNFIGKLRLEQ